MSTVKTIHAGEIVSIRSGCNMVKKNGKYWWEEADTWWEGPDELWIHNVLYHYIRNAPWLLLPKESIHQKHYCRE